VPGIAKGVDKSFFLKRTLLISINTAFPARV